MRNVYVYNSDFNSDIFTSLLMVNFNNFKLPFNNIKTTKEIFYDNIMVYIPEINIADKGSEYIFNIVREHYRKFKFKHIILCFDNTNDYEVFKKVFDCYYSDNNVHYYIGMGLSTLLASIIAIDCYYLINSKTVIKKRVFV